jgi:hypothetical protein
MDRRANNVFDYKDGGIIGNPQIVMPDLIRHPEQAEKYGSRLSPE